MCGRHFVDLAPHQLFGESLDLGARLVPVLRGTTDGSRGRP
jgi:hypothetical protein